MEAPEFNAEGAAVKSIKPRFKVWLYRIMFLLVALIVIAQYASTALIAKDLEAELNKGFDGIKFKQVTVNHSIYNIQLSAKVVPQNRFSKVDYVDLVQDLNMNVNTFNTNLDKIKQLLNQTSEFNQYTLVGTGTLKSEDYEEPLTAEFLVNGDFVIKSESGEDTQLLEDNELFMVHTKGETFTLTRHSDAVDLSYQIQPTKMFSEYGVFTADSIRYTYNSVEMPELTIEGFKVQSGTRTLGDLLNGKKADEAPSSISANLTLKGLDIDTLVYAYAIYEDLENLDEGDFKRTKLESDLQTLAMRLVKNSVSLESEFSLIDRGEQTNYEIELTMQSKTEIDSYEDMITTISGDIDRMGDSPSAKYLKDFDELLSGLSEKSDNLRYRAVAMQ